MNQCRQRPTLPHSFPCSTIGGIRLNFRVRNGNGWDPDPMTTGKLAAWGPASARSRAAARLALFRPAPPKRRRREGGSSQTICQRARIWLLGHLVIWSMYLIIDRIPRCPDSQIQCSTTEYSANGSFPDQTHAAVSACIVLSEVEPRTKEFMVKPHG